jgi:hypothetical protein
MDSLAECKLKFFKMASKEELMCMVCINPKLLGYTGHKNGAGVLEIGEKV